MWAALLVTLLGTWSMAAPAVFDLSGVHRTSVEIVGPLVVTFGAISASQVTRAVRWVNVGLGVVVALAPWALGASALPALHDTLVGTAIAGLSLVRRQSRWKQGGGWTDLFRSGQSPKPRAT